LLVSRALSLGARRVPAAAAGAQRGHVAQLSLLFAARCRGGAAVTPPQAAPPILEAQALSRAFHVGQGIFAAPKTITAVDGVSFALRPGEVLGIVGESGCGKTTLARMLLGLIEPSAGEARIDGRSTYALNGRERARLIQPVFQDPYSSLNPRRRVRDIVAL